MWTDITFVIDKSGSMKGTVEATISGFNDFIRAQKLLTEVKTTLTLIQFDDQYEVSYVMKPIQEVELLDTISYIPRGNTALYDTLGKAIAEVSERKVTPSLRSDKTIFVIITDGANNRSAEYTKEMVRTEIQAKTKEGWVFTFLAANIDVFSEGAGLGIASGNILPYTQTKRGTEDSFKTLSRSMTSYSTNLEATTTSFFEAQKDTPSNLRVVTKK